MKKKTLAGILGVAMTMAVAMPAYAGQWLSDANGWWWQNDNGSYPTNTWQWIDGNGDGVAESYYFDANGYCLMNTTTPDGYTVNGNGAWTVNGAVQTQGASNTAANQQTVNTGSVSDKQDLWTLMPVKSVNAYRRDTVTTADKSQNYDLGWSFTASFLGDAMMIYENENQEYNYLTVSFAPGSGMDKTEMGTFVVKGSTDIEDTEYKEWDELKSVAFSYGGNLQTVTVDISDYEAVLIGCRNYNMISQMIISDMYFHN